MDPSSEFPSRAFDDEIHRASSGQDSYQLYFETMPAASTTAAACLGSGGPCDVSGFAAESDSTTGPASSAAFSHPAASVGTAEHRSSPMFTTPQKRRSLSPSSMHHPRPHRAAVNGSSPSSTVSGTPCRAFADDITRTPTQAQRLLFVNSPMVSPTGGAFCLGSPSVDNRGGSLNGESPSASRQTSAGMPAIEMLMQRLVAEGPGTEDSPPPKLGLSNQYTPPQDSSSSKDHRQLPYYVTSSEKSSQNEDEDMAMERAAAAFTQQEQQAMMALMLDATNTPPPTATPCGGGNNSMTNNAEEGDWDMWRQHAACMESDEEEEGSRGHRFADASYRGQAGAANFMQQLPPSSQQASLPAEIQAFFCSPLTPRSKEEQDRLHLEAFQRSHLGMLAEADVEGMDPVEAQRYHLQQLYNVQAMRAAVEAKARQQREESGPGWASADPQHVLEEEQQQRMVMQLQAAALERQRMVLHAGGESLLSKSFPPPYTVEETNGSSPPTIFSTAVNSTSATPTPPQFTDPSPSPSPSRFPTAMNPSALLQQRYGSSENRPASLSPSMLAQSISPHSGSPSLGRTQRQGAGGSSRGNSPLSSMSSVSQGLPPPPPNRNSFHAKLKAAAGSLIAVGGRRVPVDKLHHLLSTPDGDECDSGRDEGENSPEPQHQQVVPSSRRTPGQAVRIVRVSPSPSNAAHSGTKEGRHRSEEGNHSSRPNAKSSLPPPSAAFISAGYMRSTEDSIPSASISPLSMASSRRESLPSSPGNHMSDATTPGGDGNQQNSHGNGPIVVLRFTRGELLNFRVPRPSSRSGSSPRYEVGKSYVAYIRGMYSPYGSFGYCDVGCCVQVLPNDARGSPSNSNITVHGNLVRKVDTAQNQEEANHQGELRHAEATVFQETLSRIQILNLPLQLECVHITHDHKICVLFVHYFPPANLQGSSSSGASRSASHYNAKQTQEGSMKALQKDVQRFVEYTVCVKPA